MTASARDFWAWKLTMVAAVTGVVACSGAPENRLQMPPVTSAAPPASTSSAAATVAPSLPAPANSVTPLSSAAAAPRTALVVFAENCASCHAVGTNPAASKHFSIADGAPVGHHVGALGVTMRKVLGAGGGKPTMPKGAPPLTEADRALLIAWAEQVGDRLPSKHRH